ncbi:Cationic amino acid transporter-1 [Apophysomyces sp. BC1034]|nr:Cationic amino acid transporter-1 [Apophysomyces sp. BC1015]KAG0191444.1 Cationic amino acid transporter-1 [Apophysomyces sp. BC1034]
MSGTTNTFFQNIVARYKVDPHSYLRQPDESETHYWFRRMGHLKPVELMWSESEVAGLRRVLNAAQLVYVGIGGIIGTGIFVLSGQAAAVNAGPAITISYVIAGVAAAVGWSGYLVRFFEVAFNVYFSKAWTQPTVVWSEVPPAVTYDPGCYFNIPGFVVVIMATILLCLGIKEAAWVNATVVLIKIIVILLFVVSLCGFVDKSNYIPYIPPNTGDWHFFGVPGVFAGASVVFFSYIGFDAVSTTALEAKNPRRDVPVGIIGSLGISTFLYVAVCVIMTGAAPYTELDVATPVTVAVDAVEAKTLRSWRWLNIIVALGALCGLTSVMIIYLLAQSRVFYAMGQDGLLPSWLSRIHPRFKTPYRATILVGTITAVLAAVMPIDLLGNMTSVGTLLAYFGVHIGVIVLRFTRPEVERRFRIPGGKYISLLFPIGGMAICLLLVAVAEVTTIWRLFIWMAIGWMVYFGYGIRHSRFNRDPIGRFEEAKAQRRSIFQMDELPQCSRDSRV